MDIGGRRTSGDFFGLRILVNLFMSGLSTWPFECALQHILHGLFFTLFLI